MTVAPGSIAGRRISSGDHSTNVQHGYVTSTRKVPMRLTCRCLGQRIPGKKFTFARGSIHLPLQISVRIVGEAVKSL
jgi:hypothetical protein